MGMEQLEKLLSGKESHREKGVGKNSYYKGEEKGCKSFNVLFWEWRLCHHCSNLLLGVFSSLMVRIM